MEINKESAPLESPALRMRRQMHWMLPVVGLSAMILWFVFSILTQTEDPRRFGEVRSESELRLLAKVLMPPVMPALGAPVIGEMDWPLGTRSGAFSYLEMQPGDGDGKLAGGIEVVPLAADLLEEAVVHAVADGVVVHVTEEDPHWGGVVILQHRDEDGAPVQTLYARLGAIVVRHGETVFRRAVLGSLEAGGGGGGGVGSLHFAVRKTESPYFLNEELSGEAGGDDLIDPVLELEGRFNPDPVVARSAYWVERERVVREIRVRSGDGLEDGLEMPLGGGRGG